MGTAVDVVVESRPRDLGGFSVRRTLPSVSRRIVGPFVFYDHMGPVDFAPGQGIDVRPHPHIALATITYLFDGEILHRDNIGSVQPIRPGDVNWMVAGRGIAHSERTPPDVRARGGRMHGLQTWVALPTAHEETEPRFEHHAKESLPVVEKPGVVMRVIAGTAYGAKSAVGILSPTLYVHASLAAGASLDVTDEHEQRAVYVVTGGVELEGKPFGEGTMIVLRPGASTTLHAPARSDVMLIGGASLDGERHVWWNFVASTKERIERAKTDWRERRFAPIPGDAVEFIPLPDR
jgi:redox-sensitive bicupin YhaK (pirin superfamily)